MTGSKAGYYLGGMLDVLATGKRRLRLDQALTEISRVLGVRDAE